MQSLILLAILLSLSSAGFLFWGFFQSFKEFIVPLLAVIMLSMGLTLTPEDFKRILKRPHIILYGVLLQFSVMPLTALLVARLFSLNRDLFVGVVLVGSAPGGTASNLITYISGGDLAYSISMTTLSTLLSPLLTPFWTWILAGKFVPVPFLSMAVATAKIVVLPVLTGMALRRLFGERIRKLEPVLPYVAVFSIAFIIAVILAVNRERLEGIGPKLVGAVLIHNLLGFLLGFGFGKAVGLDNRLAKTLSIEVGIQNSGLSTVLALKFFSQVSALPSALFSLSQNVIGVLLSLIFRRI